jgi:hypothetical protein
MKLIRFQLWQLLLAAGMLGLARPARAQQLLDFQYADSLTRQLLAQHRYRALDSVGHAVQALGATYPALSCRLGAGALASGRPARALRYYGAAYAENPLDSAARVGLALAYQSLNQTGPATLLAQPLPDSLRQVLGLPGPGAVISLEAEASALLTDERRRGAASFGRLGVGSRLGGRLALSQDLSYYRQQVELPRLGYPGEVRTHLSSQWQYHALLSGQLAPRWQLKAGYDFISFDLGHNHLGYLALAYAQPYVTVQAGVYAGTLADSARTQTDLRLTVYPLGNLRFYAFGRGSVVTSSGRTYPNGLLGVGGQLHPRLWAEAWAGGGQVPVLAELDGTYVYNLLDPLRGRTAVSLLILAPRRLALRLTYGLEQRHIVLIDSNYLLHSLTASLSWTW